ncbi:MAG: helix-turn-helix domain-containing protein [Zavarzinella sp.]
MINSNQTETNKLALRPREAARMLGISERTLWTWVKQGRIPCVRIGNDKRKITLFPADQLKDWLAQQATCNETL